MIAVTVSIRGSAKLLVITIRVRTRNCSDIEGIALRIEASTCKKCLLNKRPTVRFKRSCAGKTLCGLSPLECLVAEKEKHI